jgi:hypothetical protein
MHLGRTLVMLGTLALACKPRPGSSCDRGEARCLAGDTQLACHAGKMIEVPCRGPNGCQVTEKGVACDISKNVAGDPCTDADENVGTCSEDGKTKIVCRGGKYHAEPCRGRDGCKLIEGRASCDTSLMEEGEACLQEGSQACSTDNTTFLVCTKGKMEVKLRCRGASGCQFLDRKLTCDLSVAALDDPCDEKMEGKNACALDKKQIVVCKAAKFTSDTVCKAGEECIVGDGTVKCDEKQ